MKGIQIQSHENHPNGRN